MPCLGSFRPNRYDNEVNTSFEGSARTHIRECIHIRDPDPAVAERGEGAEMPDLVDAWVNAEQQTLLDRRLAQDPDGRFLDCCGPPYTPATWDREAAGVTVERR